ncbi:MAG: hypothetical protein HRT36_00620 [Alphaproteobacteria bacterium]|nr:hypothetical protein [Alphaproteobacteria bacterium]
MTYVKARKHTTDQRIQQDHDTRNHAIPDGMTRFQILQLVRNTVPQLGLSRGAARQYEILLCHSNDVDWQAGNLCICWLSVQRLAYKLSVSDRQVRNNTQRLVDLGLVAYADSGNYRRGGQRDQQDRIIGPTVSI